MAKSSSFTVRRNRGPTARRTEITSANLATDALLQIGGERIPFSGAQRANDAGIRLLLGRLGEALPRVHRMHFRDAVRDARLNALEVAGLHSKIKERGWTSQYDQLNAHVFQNPEEFAKYVKAKILGQLS